MDNTKSYPIGNCYADSASYLLFGEWKFSWSPPPIDIENLVLENKIWLVHGIPTLTRPPYKRYGHAWIEYVLTTEFEFPKIKSIVGEDVENATLDFVKRTVDMEYCLDLNSGKSFFRAAYYQAGNINPNECIKYTREQAMLYLVGYQHYGAWEGEFGNPPNREVLVG